MNHPLKQPAACSLLLLLLPGFSSPPRPQVGTPGDLSKDLGIELRSLRPWGVEMPSELLLRVAERLGRPGDFLEGVRLFEAAGKPIAAPAEIDLIAGVLPLGDPLSGARLVFAILPDGRLAQASLRGSAEFDGDPQLSWSLFLGQLSSFGALGPPEEFLQKPDGGSTGEDIERFLDQLEKRTDPDAELLRALLRQRVLMRGFALLQRRLVLQPALPLPREWLAGKRMEMEEVSGLSPAFAAILGEEDAGRHAQLAREAASYIAELQSAVESGNGREFTRLAGRARAACSSCHELPVEGQGRWDGAFAAVRDGFAPPSGVLRVGFDVAPALGDERGDSRRIADAVHGVLMLVSELRR